MSHPGKKIAEIRNRMGYTQHELSERIDCSRAYLARVEAEIQEPSLKFINSVADGLGVPVGLIFLNKDDFPDGDVAMITKWTDASKINPTPGALCIAVGPNGPQVAVFHNMMGSNGDFATITVNKRNKIYKHFPGVMWWMYLTAWPESQQIGEVKT